MRFHFSLAALALLTLTIGCKRHNDQLADGRQNDNGTVASRGAMMAPYQRTEGAQEGVVLIKFKRGMEPSGPIAMSQGATARVGIESMDKVAEDLSVSKIERVFPYSARFDKIDRKHGLDLWYKVSYDPTKMSLRRAVDSYSQLEELDWVETSGYGKLVDGDAPHFEADQMTLFAASNPQQSTTMPFNDTHLPKQWWYDSQNIQVDGVHERAGVNLFPAWEKVCGTPDIIVSIHDGGVMWDHEDLADNMWVNKGEIPYDGIDNDGNGYVDDVYGYDFVQFHEEITLQAHFHGTHVGGIVAAVNNNGKGVVGVAGGTGNKDGVRLISCQLFFGANSAPSERMAESYRYALMQGSIISQNSWNFSDPNEKHQVIEDAIHYFIEEAGNEELFPNSPMRGGLVLFSASNERDNQKYFPANVSGVIPVAATDHKRQRGGYSTYGDHIAISAPGGVDSADENVKQYMILSTYTGSNITVKNSYGYLVGTSQATPIVSGAAALLVQANPGSTNTKIKELLLSSVESLEDTEPNYLLMGKGLLNVGKTIKAERNDTPSDPISTLAVKLNNKQRYCLEWIVPTNPKGNWNDTYTVYFSNSPLTQANLSSAKKTVLTQFKRMVAGRTASVALGDIQNVDTTASLYFAVTSADQWGNVSKISNVIFHETLDPMTFALNNAMVRSAIEFTLGATYQQVEKTVKLHDQAGRTVMTKVFAPQSGKSLLSVPVSGLASGNYHYVVTDNQGQTIASGNIYKI